VKIKSKQKKLVDEYGMKKMFLAYDPYWSSLYTGTRTEVLNT
jgi:hypothetical protein